LNLDFFVTVTNTRNQGYIRIGKSEKYTGNKIRIRSDRMMW